MKKTVPEWFKKASVYQINPRTFCSEGTIKAIIKELPFLKELGFKIIYLCPIFEEDDSQNKENWSERQKNSETGNPKNPYRMNNYFKIDSEYGSMDDLREFVSEVHRLGMKAMLDLVYFHIGPNAPILKEHPEFAKLDENGNILLGNWHFPVLNYENKGLREYLLSNMVYYVGEIGVDGFRCDVGDNVPLDFWEEGKHRIKAINPQAVMINEGKKSEYLKVFDANYAWFWHDNIFKLLNGEINTAGLIDIYKERTKDFKENYFLLLDMDNHDTVTDWPYRIEEHFGSAVMEMILALNYCLKGIPMVYCGNELADTARISMFANRFYMGKYEVTNREAKNTIPSLRRQYVIKTLNKIREKHSVLADGETVFFKNLNNGVVAFERKLNGERIVFACNFSKENKKINLENLKVKTVLLESETSPHYNENTIELSPNAYVIFENM